MTVSKNILDKFPPQVHAPADRLACRGFAVPERLIILINS